MGEGGEDGGGGICIPEIPILSDEHEYEKASVERQKALTTSHLHRQLDPLP